MSPCVTPAQQQHLALINQLRAQSQLLPLRISHILHAAAEKAQQMADGDWFAHTELNGRTARQLVLDHGYPADGWTGENILWGTGDPVAAFHVWANSQAHRENLLSPHYTEIGIALNVEPAWDHGGDVFAVGVQCSGGSRTPQERLCNGVERPPKKPREPRPTLPRDRPPKEERQRERWLRRFLRRLGVKR